jgi:N-ethylmaleimide reductase
MINKSFTKETGNKVIEEGYADMVGTLYCKSDLVTRFEIDAPTYILLSQRVITTIQN